VEIMTGYWNRRGCWKDHIHGHNNNSLLCIVTAPTHRPQDGLLCPSIDVAVSATTKLNQGVTLTFGV